MKTQGRTASSLDQKLGARVRARRIEISMSQERLAELLGLTFQQVQKYEKGLNRIAASRLLDIATALDMPVYEFFDGLSGSRASASVTPTPPAGADELLRLFSEIGSVKVRRRVVDLVRAMANEN